MTEDIIPYVLVTKSLILKEDNEERFFEGILTAQIKDKQGEITVADELYKALPSWMANGGAMSDTHSNRIIGKGINFEKIVLHDKEGNSVPGIKIMGVVFKNTALADEIWSKMKSGEYKGLSFGGSTKAGRTPVAQKDGSIAYELKDLELYEVAICEDPAVPFARITNMNPKAKAYLTDTSKQTLEKYDEDKLEVKCDGVNCYVTEKDITATMKSYNITKPLPNPSGGKDFKDFDACQRWAGSQDNVRDPQALCGSIENRTHGNPMKKGEEEKGLNLGIWEEGKTEEKAGQDFPPQDKYREDVTNKEEPKEEVTQMPPRDRAVSEEQHENKTSEEKYNVTVGDPKPTGKPVEPIDPTKKVEDSSIYGDDMTQYHKTECACQKTKEELEYHDYNPKVDITEKDVTTDSMSSGSSNVPNKPTTNNLSKVDPTNPIGANTNTRGLGAYNTSMQGQGSSEQIKPVEESEKADIKPETLGDPTKLDGAKDPINPAPKKTLKTKWSIFIKQKKAPVEKRNIRQLLGL
jgi:hypothetical protein